MYNSPHALAANQTTGNHIYTGNGWGMMSDIPTSFSANAWERWHMGWVELLASNGQSYATVDDGGIQTINAVRVNSDVQDASSLTATNGYYTLRDYVTTGDVVRIRLPNTNQYLWLENRAKNGPFDRRNAYTWTGGQSNVPFLSPGQGLLAMVESLSDRTPITANNDPAKVNQLRPLSAAGNFDFVASGPPSTYNNHLYGNLLYNFIPTANASGGVGQLSRIRLDKNNDNIISIDATSGNVYGVPSTNEMTWQVIENGQINDGTFGPNIGSRTVGFRYGLNTNPLLTNTQVYDANSQTLSEMALSGLSVQITAYNASTGEITVKVRYDDTQLRANTRWTGQLRTYPVANATNGAEISVYNGVRLTLDRSLTPQRSNKNANGDFVNDTRMTIGAGTRLRVESAGNLDLRGQGTTLFVENGGSVYVGGGGKTTAYAGTTISVQNRADLSGNGELLAGARLIVRGNPAQNLTGPAVW